MILCQWSCDLPEDLLEEFLNWAEQKLKPFYELYGARHYALFMPVEKRYFDYQTVQGKTRYTEHVSFDSISDFEKFLERVEKDPSAKRLIESYERKFHVSSCSFKIFIQKV